jgi:hypothetical protein
VKHTHKRPGCGNNHHLHVKKFKEALSVRKIMATAFRDHKSVLVVNFLDHDNAIAECYCGTLEI